MKAETFKHIKKHFKHLSRGLFQKLHLYFIEKKINHSIEALDKIDSIFHKSLKEKNVHH